MRPHLPLLLTTAVIVVTLIGCTWWLVRTMDDNTGSVLQDLEQHSSR